MDVGQSDGHGVSCIMGRCLAKAQQPADHEGNLHLFSAPVTDDRLLDFGRGVVGDFDISGPENREQGPPGFGQDDGRPGITASERGFDGRLIGTELFNDLGHPAGQVGQTSRPVITLCTNDTKIQ